MTTNITEVTAQAHFPIKLTPNNFPVWRKQVVATLIGLGLDSFVDGTNKEPSKTLATDASKTNPAHLTWYRQDQTILGALLGSCSDPIRPLISSANTSFEAFQRLSSSYASTSNSRVISLKTRIGNNPRGTRPVAEYLHDMKTIADDLALAQSPVSDEDLVVHVLGQLGDEFAHVVAAVKMRETPIKFTDLFEKLVDHERNLKPALGPSITTVNYTQKSPSNRPMSFRPNSDSKGPTATSTLHRLPLLSIRKSTVREFFFTAR